MNFSPRFAEVKGIVTIYVDLLVETSRNHWYLK
jgi:hypothetical protein